MPSAPLELAADAHIPWLYALGITLTIVSAIAIAGWLLARRRYHDLQAEKARSEERFALVADALPGTLYSYTVFSDGSRRMEYVSSQLDQWAQRFPAMAALLPLRPGAANALMDPAVAAEARRLALDAIHPDDLPTYRVAIQNARDTFTRFTAEYRLKDVQGVYRWLYTTANPRRIPNGITWEALTLDIDTERTLREAATQSEARFRRLIEAAPFTAIQFYDRQGHVTLWNDASEKMYGWTRQQALGKSIGTLMLNTAQAAEFQLELDRLAAGGIPGQPVELPYRTASGSVGTLISSIFALPTADASPPTEFACMDLDITPMAQAIETRNKVQDQLALTLEASHTGTWRVNIADDTVIADETVIALFGLTDRIKPNTPTPNAQFFATIASEDLPAIRRAWDDAIAGPGPYAVQFRTRFGTTERWISGRGRVIRNASGHPVEVVGVSVDITDLKLAEAQRQQALITLERAKRLEALGMLAAGVAHDFNNILTSIAGNAALARQATVPSLASHHLDLIEHAAHQAGTLTNQLLRQSADAPAAPLTPATCDTILHECVDVARTTIGRPVAVRITLAQDAPPIAALPADFRQIALNLIINANEAARQAGPDADIRIDYTLVQFDHPRVTTGLHAVTLAPGRYAALQVSDTGVGMDEPTRQRIFEPFFSTKTSGRGLGLSVVAAIVHKLGGTIDVASTPGQGTTFRVLLPAASAAQPLPAPAPPIPAPPQPALAPTRVLIVDDDDLVRDVITRALKQAGFELIVCNSGVSAINTLRAAHPASTPHAALIDLSMPELNGIDTLHALRKLQPGLPAAIVSGYLDPDTKRQLETLKHTTFLPKPFRLTDLPAIIARLTTPTAAQ
ncbi:MAG: PAS domain-containing protein [Phycisphaerales bacterium]|jgi:PAS domain S-box-containing protein|nr:PAS domain-containing protein [Phycisphaerales bacterium]